MHAKENFSYNFVYPHNVFRGRLDVSPVALFSYVYKYADDICV